MEQSKEEFENSVGEPEKVVSYTLIKIMFKKKLEYHRLIHMKIQGSSKLPTLITLYHHMNHMLWIIRYTSKCHSDAGVGITQLPPHPNRKNLAYPSNSTPDTNKEITKARANAQPQVAT